MGNLHPKKKSTSKYVFWYFSLSQIEDSIHYLEGPNSAWKHHDRNLGVQTEHQKKVLLSPFFLRVHWAGKTVEIEIQDTNTKTRFWFLAVGSQLKENLFEMTAKVFYNVAFRCQPVVIALVCFSRIIHEDLTSLSHVCAANSTPRSKEVLLIQLRINLLFN